MDEVRVREVPERVVLVERRSVNAAEVPGFIEEALTRHRGVLGDAPVAAAPFVVFVRPMAGEIAGVAEVCTPVPDEIARREGLPLRVEPVHREAYTTVTKRELGYPAVLEAHALVETWAREQGLTVIGASREVRFADLRQADDDELVADVALPVA